MAKVEVEDVWAKATAATAARDGLQQAKDELKTAEDALEKVCKRVEEARTNVDSAQRTFDIALASLGKLCDGIPPMVDDQ